MAVVTSGVSCRKSLRKTPSAGDSWLPSVRRRWAARSGAAGDGGGRQPVEGQIKDHEDEKEMPALIKAPMVAIQGRVSRGNRIFLM